MEKQQGGDAGSSVRVYAVGAPESTESGGGGGAGGGAMSTDSQEGEAHALMHEAPMAPSGPTLGDKIEDVEMLDGSVPTKLGVSVNINKLVDGGTAKMPGLDLAAVQNVAGLGSQNHGQYEKFARPI